MGEPETRDPAALLRDDLAAPLPIRFLPQATFGGASATAPTEPAPTGAASPAAASPVTPPANGATPPDSGAPHAAPTPEAPPVEANLAPAARADVPAALPIEGATSAPEAPVNELRVAATQSVEAPRLEPETLALPERPTFRPELGRAVLDRIRFVLRPDLRSATIDLHPAELGRVQIRVAMKDGVVSAVFRAETVQAREILERQLPELRASLAQAGLETERVEVELGQPSADDSRRERSEPRAPRTRTLDLGLEAPASSLTLPTPSASASGVDTFA